MQPEIELKLDLMPQAAEMFASWPSLPMENQTAALHAIYFDTPDQQLGKRGMSLRIRRTGRRRVQTVKADGRDGAGLFARDEWEMPVRGVTPVLDDRTPVAALLGEAVGQVDRLFTVDVQRRTWMVKQDSATIELVLDRGAVLANGREQAICEIELELKAGEPAALFALARRIDADIAVRPGVLSKAERGYRLTQALPAAVKAEKVALDPTMSIRQAFLRIVAACLRHYRLNEALLLDQYTAEALHQARVAIRRLRSALKLFKPVLQAADVARFQRELRWLAGVLGEARDLDVLAPRIGGDAARARLAVAQGQAHDRVLQWLESARVRMVLLDLVEWMALGAGLDAKAGRSVVPFAATGLRKLRKGIAKGGRHMMRLSDEARHSVRKDAKRLRYGAEFFAGLFDGKQKRRRRHKAFLDKLESMQDALGALNDLVTTPATLARHGLPCDIGTGGVEKAELVAAAAIAHGDLVDARRFWT
ncbi:CHAD domain-containing protein [Sphingobium sp. Z007]|uniref:CYTH and CHAD domain-containing protein n=1 Tax=Sphingobium sp. Z007 TaxID=627495 RepID=UPI000B4A4C04|nr:CHAD domain-containing protein [Sphingobium sp. Z007]